MESGNENFIDALRVWKENPPMPAHAGCISHGCFVHVLKTVVFEEPLCVAVFGVCV